MPVITTTVPTGSAWALDVTTQGFALVTAVMVFGEPSVVSM
jgi:hypothetical protein